MLRPMSKSLRDALLWQSNVCLNMGAPLTAEVLRLIAEDDAVALAFEPLFLPCAHLSTRDLVTGAHPLRVLGGLHFIVLSGRSLGLAACYADGDGQGLGAALVGAVREHFNLLATFMTSPPQTNEVRRALCLFGGFLKVAEETGLPLRCLELGASAGLNQNWDRFFYDLGALGAWGDPASPVKLSGAWTGAAPPLAVKAIVAERAACDQNPIEVREEGAALRLLAYIWPDQADRLERARAAIALAREVGVALEKADAADWVVRHAHPKTGLATVVYHSIFMQYPPKETRDLIIEAIHEGGRAATADAPFAWLRMEPGVEASLVNEVWLTSWPGGEDRLLAYVHSHGASVDWRVGTESGA
jgi:hypothetical protein